MYEEDIYRTAFVYLKNQEEALDVVQETAYRSFKSIKNVKEPEYFKTWLIRITISCSIDLLRQRKKIVHLNQDYQEVISAKQEEEDIPLSLTLRDLIEFLGEQEKEVIILRYYHDYTIKAIADLLELPLGTVKTILYRSLKKLRQQVKEVQLYE